MPSRRPHPGRRRATAATRLAVVALTLAAAAACGSDGPDAADERAEQVRQVALDAGLPADVADVLATAARGVSATFQISYPGPDGTALVVSQDPPHRRLDALEAGLIVESQVLVDGVAYACELPEGGRPGDDLTCRRTSAALPGTGAFTAEALETFAAQLAAGLDAVDLAVEARSIAGVETTCLVATPRTDEAPADTICVAEDGAQLLVEVGGERRVADAYSPTVPDGTFDV